MSIHTIGKPQLLATNPDCIDCGRSLEPSTSVVVSNHLLCIACANSLKRCTSVEWRRRIGSYALKRLVPQSEIGNFDIRSDPAFVFTSLDDVTRDHWEEIVKRLHGFARSIIGQRTAHANESLTTEVSTRIVRGMVEGAAKRLQWNPDECPNLLRWLVDRMKEEIDLLIPEIPDSRPNRPRQPWQTIVLPPDEQKPRAINFNKAREAFVG